MNNLDGQDNLDRQQGVAAVMLASRRIHAAVDMLDHLVSERLGVDRSGLRCLNLLEHGPLTPGEIGARTGLTSGSVTALLDRLERAGLAERQRAASDRRSVEVAIPAVSHHRIGTLYRTVAGSVTAAFAGQEPAELAAVATVLDRFAEALETGTNALAQPGQD